jgi:hypothetical protein
VFAAHTDQYLARFQVLTAASIKMTVFWGVASCSFVEIDRRFRLRKQYAPLKLQYTSTRLHGGISHKAVIFRSTSVSDESRFMNIFFILIFMKKFC